MVLFAYLIALLGPVVVCWFAVWKFAEHFGRGPNAQQALAWTHHGDAAAPLLWLATTATLVASGC